MTKLSTLPARSISIAAFNFSNGIQIAHKFPVVSASYIFAIPEFAFQSPHQVDLNVSSKSES
jgi:hypothetical protein